MTGRVGNLRHYNTQKPQSVPKVDMAPNSSRSQSFTLRKSVKDEDGPMRSIHTAWTRSQEKEHHHIQGGGNQRCRRELTELRGTQRNHRKQMFTEHD